MRTVHGVGVGPASAHYALQEPCIMSDSLVAICTAPSSKAM